MLAASAASLSVGAAAWICCAFVLGSFAQAVSGFGFALVAIPLASLVVSPTDAVVIQTLASCLLSLVMAWNYRHDTDRVVLRSMLSGVIVGIPIGMVVASSVSDRALRFGVGVAVIVAALSIATGFRIKTSRPNQVNAVAGVVSGVLGATTGTNGPPLVVTMAGQDVAPATFRANLQAAFAVSNLILVPLFIAAGKVTRIGLVGVAIALVPTLVGRVVGERVFARLDPTRFRRVVLGMLFLAGTVAIVKAITG
jgi:uncharacterized protein